MTKPDEEMDVVEMDAIDHGDWETNMSTSELSVAGLAALVRQTASAPVMERPPQTRVAPAVARPSVSAHTPVPVKAPPTQAPAPVRQTAPLMERPLRARIAPIQADAPVPVDLDVVVVERAPATRLASRRILLIAAGAAGVLGIVVGMIVVLGSGPRSSEVTEPAAALAAPAPERPAIARPAIAKPVIAATTRETGASPAPPRRAGGEPARSKAVTPTRQPASHATAVHHPKSPPAKKRVATRTPASAAPPVASDVVDRARAEYNTGNEALFAGDTDAAIRAYQEVVGSSPTLAFGYRGLGLAYAQRGDTTAAIAALRRYLELAPHAKDAALIRKRLLGLQHAR